MKNAAIILNILLLLTGKSIAQEMRCGTMENLEMLKNSDSNYEDRLNNIEQLVRQRLLTDSSWRTNGVITIPVVFHILYNVNNVLENISLARINAQMAILNQSFSASNPDIIFVPAPFAPFIGNVGIQFCLAVRDPQGNATDGIIRKQTGTTFFTTNNNIKFDSNGGDDAWPSDSYLNIWVGTLANGVLGFAQFPGGASATDGVVIHNAAVGGPASLGSSTNYNKGRTAVHEIGHWLNLNHINGDAACGDDFVSDTPTQSVLHAGCPFYPQVSCSNGPSGDMFMNYMDYVYDMCMIMFTSGQSARMNTSFSVSRSAILNSMGCVPVSIGLDEVSKNGISVYPNPTNGPVTIESAGLQAGITLVKVFNLMGQNLKTVEYLNLNDINYLDISELSNGVYFVEINTRNSNSVYRIILDKKD